MSMRLSPASPSRHNSPAASKRGGGGSGRTPPRPPPRASPRTGRSWPVLPSLTTSSSARVRTLTPTGEAGFPLGRIPVPARRRGRPMQYGKGEMLKRRRTKVVATVGPASDSPAMLGTLIDAGVNVFRLNMSHGEHSSHRRPTNASEPKASPGTCRSPSSPYQCGPKIRVGRFEQGAIDLEVGATVIAHDQRRPRSTRADPLAVRGAGRRCHPRLPDPVERRPPRAAGRTTWPARR